mgnify:CR=1 FL=1
MSEFEKVSWRKIENGCRKIAEWARPQKFDYVYGVKRGGLIPGVILSHELNIPLCTSIHEFHKGKSSFKLICVDDICQKGATFNRLRESIPWGKFVSIYFSDESNFIPDFYVYLKKKSYLVFPWENHSREAMRRDKKNYYGKRKYSEMKKVEE